MKKLIQWAALMTMSAVFNTTHAQSTTFDSSSFNKLEFQGNKCTGFFNTPSWRCDPISIPAYLRPADNNKAVVFISHGSQGLDKRHSDYADQLVRSGINAVVLGHWEARGLGQLQGDYDKARKSGGDSPNQVLDVLAAATQLTSLPEWQETKVGHIGESMGGTTAMNLTRPYLRRAFAQLYGRDPAPLRAIAALYAGCTERNSNEVFLPIPILFLHGDEDDDTLASDCVKQVPWMNGRGGRASITLLKGEVHDFDAPHRWKRFRAQNPAKCASLREGDQFTLEINGKRYPGTPEGYAQLRKDCIGLSPMSVMSGHKASPRTGFSEWTAFFEQAFPRSAAPQASIVPAAVVEKTDEQRVQRIMKDLNFK